jgi:hypothetical protein
MVAIKDTSKRKLTFSARVQARALLTGWEDRWWDSVPIYSTEPTYGAVGPSQSETINVNAILPNPVLMFPGLQIWLLVFVDGKPSDEALLGSERNFTKGSPAFMRPAAPTGAVALIGLDPTGNWRHSAAQTVTVSVGNLTGASQTVDVWFYLATINDPHPWTDGVLRSGPVRITLTPWTTQSVSLGVTRPPLGNWGLSAFADYEQSAATFVHSDGIFLVQPVAVK